MSKINQTIVLSSLSFCFIVIAIIFSICNYEFYTILLSFFAILIALLSFYLNVNNLKYKK